jgi:hypothetical protein
LEFTIKAVSLSKSTAFILDNAAEAGSLTKKLKARRIELIDKQEVHNLDFYIDRRILGSFWKSKVGN